jgi:CheY-like chemotaxis protein
VPGLRSVSLFRKNPRFGHLSVVLVSGHPEHELERLRQEVGADAVLSKRDLERLPALVKRFASKAR